MIPTLVEWQRIDPETGLVECWFTHPFLDELKKWDLKEVKWLEFGAGLGTAYLRKRCKWVDTIEANESWALKANEYCNDNALFNGLIYSKQIADGVQGNQEAYFGLIPDEKYDIVSVDGIFRTEALEWAIKHFSGRSGIIIADNFSQDFVWHSPRAIEVMSPYEEHVYYQPDHKNHEGNPWNTRYWKITA